MTTIQLIEKEDTYLIRNEALRKELPIENCFFEGDELTTTTHLGIYNGKEIFGVISIYRKLSTAFQETKQFQLRGMAILESEQKKGHGKTLIQYLEQFLKPQSPCLIWFNARETAVPFYKSLDYKIQGNLLKFQA